MIEEAERRDSEMAEDERQATDYAAIIAGRPALAERLAECQAAVDEKMDEIISRHKADYQRVGGSRAKKTDGRPRRSNRDSRTPIARGWGEVRGEGTPFARRRRRARVGARFNPSNTPINAPDKKNGR